MRKEVSSTFHGRDIFAPAAAYLASGVQFSMFGCLIQDPVRLPDLLPTVKDNVLHGEVVRFDRFGNAITNISGTVIQDFADGRPITITLRDMSFSTIHKSYYEGEVVSLIGSAGYLEFGLFMGSLREKMGLCKGDPVTIAIL
jgi:S-adenosylmethionine hydrolase